MQPTIAGVLFDLPVDRAIAPMRALDLVERCGIVGGDLFKEVPASGDVHLLKHVIHAGITVTLH